MSDADKPRHDEAPEQPETTGTVAQDEPEVDPHDAPRRTMRRHARC